MPIRKEHLVPKKERSSASRDGALDWESARVFLEIARAKSFRAAAVTLGQSVNALRRKFEKLQVNLGTTLLTRHVYGVRLTPEGQRALAAAQRMEAASFELVRGRDLGKSALSGEVKLAATEGLGSFWIVPHLVEYRSLHPNLTVNLFCAMSPVDVFRVEADVAIQFRRPLAKDLKIVKVGRLHSMPFASKSYVAAHGIPKTAADLQNHQIVYQTGDQVTHPRDTPAAIQAALHKGRGVMRTNASSALYEAVINGVGIGMLPTYANAVGNTLTPLDIGYRTQHDIWLVYHPDAGRIARVHTIIDWMIEIFSPKRFPWFGDQFIHPEDLPPAVRSLSMAEPIAKIGPPRIGRRSARARHVPRKTKTATTPAPGKR